MELFVLNNNTWNSLTVYLEWIISITSYYFEPFESTQMNE